MGKRKGARQRGDGNLPGAYNLGVGEGRVDPDFDSIEEGERDAIEGVMGHGRTEDYD